MVTLTGARHESCPTSAKDGVRYAEVEREIAGAAALYNPERYKPFLWFIPPYIEQGPGIEEAFNTLPYAGIKLHPRAHRWDLGDKRHLACLHSLFAFADENALPILIHTGEGEFERPGYFRDFFSRYSKARCILAHCRPVPDTVALFRSCPNVYGDTAFLSFEGAAEIIKTGFKNRLLPGSDFPITHYFAVNFPKAGVTQTVNLREQYRSDIKQITLLMDDMN
jgi:predicted TIM-barrel fold metal-dependent hydrolase